MTKQYRDDDFLVMYDPEVGIRTIYCNSPEGQKLIAENRDNIIDINLDDVDSGEDDNARN